MRALALVLCLIGCREAEHYPGGPGGGGGGGGGSGGGADGGAGGGDGGSGEVTIHVCRMFDLRGLCSAWDETPLELRVGGGSATTVTGDFTVATPDAPEIVTLDDPDGVFFGAAVQVVETDVELTIGVIANSDLDDVFLASGITPVPGTGVTILHFDDPGGGAAAGVVLDVARSSDAWYATTDPVVFVLDSGTDESGTAGYFDLTPGDFAVEANYIGTAYQVTGYAVADALVTLTATLVF